MRKLVWAAMAAALLMAVVMPAAQSGEVINEIGIQLRDRLLANGEHEYNVELYVSGSGISTVSVETPLGESFPLVDNGSGGTFLSTRINGMPSLAFMENRFSSNNGLVYSFVVNGTFYDMTLADVTAVAMPDAHPIITSPGHHAVVDGAQAVTLAWNNDAWTNITASGGNQVNAYKDHTEAYGGTSTWLSGSATTSHEFAAGDITDNGVTTLGVDNRNYASTVEDNAYFAKVTEVSSAVRSGTMDPDVDEVGLGLEIDRDQSLNYETFMFWAGISAQFATSCTLTTPSAETIDMELEGGYGTGYEFFELDISETSKDALDTRFAAGDYTFTITYPDGINGDQPDVIVLAYSEPNLPVYPADYPEITSHAEGDSITAGHNVTVQWTAWATPPDGGYIWAEVENVTDGWDDGEYGDATTTSATWPGAYFEANKHYRISIYFIEDAGSDEEMEKGKGTVLDLFTAAEGNIGSVSITAVDDNPGDGGILIGGGLTGSGDIDGWAVAPISEYSLLPGTYDVFADNGSEVRMRQVTITASQDEPVAFDFTNARPVAVAALLSPSTPVVGESFTLTGRDSYDPEGSLDSYVWSLLGGPGDVSWNLADPANPIVTASAEGTYTFSLLVTDTDGLESAVVDMVNVTVIVDAANPAVLAEQIFLLGSINDSSGIASLTVNGEAVIPESGGWQATVNLAPGQTSIPIVAVDTLGNITRRTLTVSR